MRMKNFIAVILCFSVLAGILSFNAIAEEYDSDPIFDQEVEFLTKLNVLDENLEPYFNMTRAQYVKTVAKIMYHNVEFGSEDGFSTSVFKDVETNHPDYKYLKAMYDLDIINGDSKGNFRPDDFITYNEALVVLVNALGYTVYADAFGGYPAGYFEIAKKAGITKGVSATMEPTGYVLLKMLYNGLFADLVSIDAIEQGNISVEINKNSNILAARLGIYEYDARVVDNGYVSITGNPSIDMHDKVVLENTKDGTRNVVYTCGADISRYLGRRVKAFVKLNEQNGNNELVHYSIHKNNIETLYNADDIISIDANGIHYEKDDSTEGKIYTHSFTSGGPLVIFNGQHITSDIYSYLPSDGFVNSVDYNSDNRIDFLEIISFNVEAKDNGTFSLDLPERNIIVGSVDTENEYIGCKFYPANGLDLKDSNYIFIMNDDVKSISDIHENDVISIAQSREKTDGKYYYQLAVKRKAVSGTVSGVSESENTITLNGNEYEVSSGLSTIKRGFLNYLDFSLSYDFLINATGKIAYSKTLVSGNKNYAYLMGAKLSSAPSEQLVGKFLTKDGEIKEYVFADKVTVDGQRKDKPSDVLNLIKKRTAGSNPRSIGAPSDIYNTNYQRPVILKLNAKDEITNIDTDNLNFSPGNDFTYYTSETHIPYSQMEVEDEKALKAGFRSPRIEELTRYTNSLSGRFYVSADSLVMMVPDIDVYALDLFPSYASNKIDSGYNQPFKYNMIKMYESYICDENYTVTVGSNLSRNFAYDIQGYDIDPDTGVANLVVIRGNTSPYIYGRVPYDTTYPLQVYLRKSSIYDSEKGKTVTKIYYTTDGKKEESAIIDTDDTLYAYKYLIEGCKASDTPYNIAYTPLKEGDIIRVIKSGNELTHIERVYHTDNIENALSSGLFPSFPRVMYSEALTGISALPCDERGYYAGYMNGYYLGVSRAKSHKGNNLTAIMGKKYISDIDLSNPSSFVIQSIDTRDTTYVLIETDADGNIKHIAEGNETDIKTVEEFGLENSSLLVYHDLYHQVNKIIIINRIQEG